MSDFFLLNLCMSPPNCVCMSMSFYVNVGVYVTHTEVREQPKGSVFAFDLAFHLEVLLSPFPNLL